MIRAIVCDIEGTTTDIAFVHETLFPYARERLPDFVRQHEADPDVQACLNETRLLAGEPDADLMRCISILTAWIDEDRKATPLKQLQGLIWKDGYARGDFHGHLYPDAQQRLARWHAQGLRLYIYSSGSVQAQQLLFGHTTYGDLRDWFSGWFDTRTGPKREALSYERIRQALALPAGQILFLSDIGEELDAARTAGLQTCQLVRGRAPDSGHPQVSTFSNIVIEDFQ